MGLAVLENCSKGLGRVEDVSHRRTRVLEVVLNDLVVYELVARVSCGVLVDGAKARNLRVGNHRSHKKPIHWDARVSQVYCGGLEQLVGGLNFCAVGE